MCACCHASAHADQAPGWHVRAFMTRSPQGPQRHLCAAESYLLTTRPPPSVHGPPIMARMRTWQFPVGSEAPSRAAATCAIGEQILAEKGKAPGCLCCLMEVAFQCTHVLLLRSRVALHAAVATWRLLPSTQPWSPAACCKHTSFLPLLAPKRHSLLYGAKWSKHSTVEILTEHCQTARRPRLLDLCLGHG